MRDSKRKSTHPGNNKDENETPSISQEQLQELKMMFDYLDRDQSGVLESHEMSKLIEMIMGTEASEEEKLDLMAEVDQDGNGSIEFGEFKSLFERKLMKTNFRKEMQLAFDLIDVNKKKFITVKDLERICGQLNMEFTIEDIEKMIQKGSQADPGNGIAPETNKVFFSQFLQMMND